MSTHERKASIREFYGNTLRHWIEWCGLCLKNFVFDGTYNRFV